MILSEKLSTDVRGGASITQQHHFFLFHSPPLSLLRIKRRQFYSETSPAKIAISSLEKMPSAWFREEARVARARRRIRASEDWIPCGISNLQANKEQVLEGVNGKRDSHLISGAARRSTPLRSLRDRASSCSSVRLKRELKALYVAY